jgi:SAM-dependent methyltransferase
VPKIVNVDMAKAWDGAEGESWVEHEEHQDLALVAHTEQLLVAAAVDPSEHVLDVGCGCGEVTRACARLAPEGDALGLDLSTAMLARARERAAEAGLHNAEFEHADAQVHPLDAHRCDLVVSRFGVMFFGDPVAAFRNIARGMASDGRLALMVWQELRRNEWLAAVRQAIAVGRTLPEPPIGAPGPFGLADPDAARSILETAGFASVSFAEVEAPFRLGADADDAYAFARNIGPVRGLLDGLDADDTTRALDELRATVDAHDTEDGVIFGSAAWIIHAVRDA